MQQRFSGGRPKCLYETNGETVLQRLISRLQMPATTVLHMAWRPKYEAEVEALGLTTVFVPPNKSIGHSIAAGMRACCSYKPVLIIAADTYVPLDLPLLIPEPGCAIFDPWEWITIYCLVNTPANADHFRAKCRDRVEYLTLGTLMTTIHRTSYINVNTIEDLDRCR